MYFEKKILSGNIKMGFENIIGQEDAIRKIEELLRRENFPSVVLFYGPSGVGKRLTAYGVAKALNCNFNNREGTLYCNRCESCRKIENKIHPDLHFVDKDGSSIKIEQIRDLIRDLNQVQFEGKRRIAIIDNAETMTLQSANALLKTLEEPPKNTNIILISSQPDKLPLTLRSRCYPIRFQPLPENVVLEMLKKFRNDYPEERLRIVGALANGSIENAMAFLEVDIQKERQNFLQLIGGMDYNKLDYYLFSEEKIEDREIIKKHLLIFKGIILDLLFCKTSIFWKIRNVDVMDDMKRIADRISKTRLLRIYGEIEEFEKLLEMNINLKIQGTRLLLSILQGSLD